LFWVGNCITGILLRNVQGECNPFLIADERRFTIVGLKEFVGSYPYFCSSIVFS
jgi:hypothetical protein